ncbi:MAG: FeoB-associated Cys-rich membrane protein [Synergistaceae bacterium]|nr:FeoB-associated Cys-rich membrane protein [Synergistaceae bacterium]
MIATTVISILLFAAVAAILMKMNKNRRDDGKSSCGCGGNCGSCSGSPLCHPPKKADK